MIEKKLSKMQKFGIWLLFLGLFMVYEGLFNRQDWRATNMNSARIAPMPYEEEQAVVLVYVARTFNWRKYFAVHPWIAIKEKGAESYTTYQVIGWNLRRGKSVVSMRQDLPDRYWYGQKPTLIEMLVGSKAESAIPKIKKAVESYPYPDKYHAWPGPNSNTFVSYIIRNVPELGVELPPIAIGKDFLGYNKFFEKSETGTGWQASFWGLIGISAGKAEGIEFNFLGFVFGIDFYNPALKLPLLGRIGFADRPVNREK